MRMHLEDGRRAVSAQIAISDHLELIHGDRLSARVPWVRFRSVDESYTRSGKHYGGALFDIGDGLAFADRVERETRLNTERLSLGVSMDGLTYNGDGIELRGWKETDCLLRAEWVLSDTCWTRSNPWEWARGLQHALSFLGGRTVRLLERTTTRGRCHYVERRVRRTVDKLGYLAMVPRGSMSPDRIDTQRIVALTRFFLSGRREAFIARQMCAQMAEAARQQTMVAQEWICANVLDAALRTLEGRPYKRKDRETYTEACMDAFREQYLSPEAWAAPCQTALNVYRGLRHRNAHPDWLTQEGGGLSRESVERSTDDMIWLAWFYGYMILAMAGLPDLRPHFPTPHRAWKPLITITTPPAV
ncbi:MAG: hypothetical protein ACYTFA_03985 [Planctomycetota bacterium]|jgi:hypothetical protein